MKARYIYALIAVSLTGLSAASAADNDAGCALRVTTDPAGAMITCDGRVREIAPLTITDLEPGVHLLVATKPGYADKRQTVSLSRGQRAAVTMKLEQLTGLLLVHSDPEGADIVIDGAHRGKTPLLITDLPLGKYRMRLTSPGYHTREVDIALNDRTPVKKQVSLKSDAATLVLKSDPAGARVKLNGVPRGVTPCAISRIPEGDAELQMDLDGYAGYKDTVKLRAGEEQTIDAKLELLPSVLSVFSLPEGARIYIDNEFRGQAPVTVENMKPGVHRIRAEMDNHEPVARSVRLEPGKTTREEFRLSGNVGFLSLTTIPPGVTVTVDGRPAGATAAAESDATKSDPLKIGPLAPGEHTITLQKDGFDGIDFKSTVENGRTVAIRKELDKRFVVDYEIHTRQGAVYRGMLIEKDEFGNVKLALRPGVYKTFAGMEVKLQRPLADPSR